MPLVGIGQHLGLGEAAHLHAHLAQRLVEARVAEGRDGGLRGNELGEPALGRLRAALRDQVRDRVLEPAHFGLRDAEPDGPHGFALAHGDSPGQLRQVFAECGRDQQPLHLAEAALCLEARAPGQHLPQGLDVGGKPGQPMGRRLCRVESARRLHLSAHRGLRMVQKALGGRDSLLEPLKSTGSRSGGDGGAHLGHGIDLPGSDGRQAGASSILAAAHNSANHSACNGSRFVSRDL